MGAGARGSRHRRSTGGRGGGPLGGTLTATTNGSGVASFTNLSITGVAGDRTLSFSATGLTAATSGTITITAGGAAQVTITTQPSNSAPRGGGLARPSPR